MSTCNVGVDRYIFDELADCPFIAQHATEVRHVDLHCGQPPTITLPFSFSNNLKRKVVLSNGDSSTLERVPDCSRRRLRPNPPYLLAITAAWKNNKSCWFFIDINFTKGNNLVGVAFVLAVFNRGLSVISTGLSIEE